MNVIDIRHTQDNRKQGESPVPDLLAVSPSDATASQTWHALDNSLVMTKLDTADAGLSDDEAQSRLEAFGPNALPAAPEKSLFSRIMAQFNNALIYVLLAAAVVTALLGHWIDTGVILGVVVINAAIGFWQEGKAENALAAVRGMLSSSATVLRRGQRQSIAAEELVPGDIVLIEAGDRVPADLRLITAKGLRIDEAPLTGESVPSEKDTASVAAETPLADRSSMAYSGTLVSAGRATAVVVGTGALAEIGRIGAMLDDVAETTTPLLKQIDAFSKWLTGVVLVLCGFIFALAVFGRGYSVDDAFLATIGMAVAAIPEGLPAVITITLALGVQRMAGRQAIIRQLPAVETLGAVSVICTDKTGTLTLNEMVVRDLQTGADAAEISVTGEGYRPEGRLVSDQGDPIAAGRHLIATGVLCSDARLMESDGRWHVSGDPMDGALISLAHKAGFDPADLRRQAAVIDEIPFDSANRFNAVLTQDRDERQVHIKGAPHSILDMCDHHMSADGMAPLNRDVWHDHIERLAERGQRVLAFAFKDGEERRELDVRTIGGGFTLLGIAGFVDPPRPEAIEAIRDCHDAGIGVKMITGDHATTALAIASELGLRTQGGVLTGADIDMMASDDLRERAAKVDVFARATPENKLRLIEALQAQDKVVSMTGDGVNDAPALKKADVGVAMGIKGTEAAKSASRVVLADDNFASIAAAVSEGRTVYDNIRKVISWTLPTNGGESLIIITAILFGLTLPLLPAHILWINMVTAVALGLTLAFEPPEATVMRRPPRKAVDSILTMEMVWRIVLVSCLMAGAAFAAFIWSTGRGDSVEYARTLAVNVIVTLEIFYLFSVRALDSNGLSLQTFFGSRPVLIGVGLTVLLQAAFTYTPIMQLVFETEAVSIADNGLLLLMGLGLLLVLEAEKAVRRQLRS
ncbi:MAG: cation-transporting P-type ATPase [Hyphomonas sp.]|nr:cation-transporting P-type ATPase [Hyphomonas sp.]